jgi:hypothetical protein
VRYIETPKH